MGLMDELSKLPPNSLGGTDKSFIDADTIADPSGERYRLQGVDAGEVEKIIGGQYKEGTAGGQATTDIVSRLASEQGFTNLVPLFNPDGTPQRDPFGRIVSDLTNDKGESFKTQLLEAGAFDVNKYTTEEDILARDIAEARRQQQTLEGDYTENAFDQAATDIKQAELNEGKKQMGFKLTALNEAQRQQYIDAGLGHVVTGDVQVRRNDRDINNVAHNPFTDSWEQGWVGVGEAAFGFANLIGEETGFDGLASWGEDGVIRQQSKLAEYGTTTLDYKDVDGFYSAIEYLGNNLALSIPYMAGTIGATAAGALAAPVVGAAGALAIGVGAPATIYTGQVWNEMEGEKNAAVAIGAGVTQAALDRLGINFILPKGVGTKKITDAALDAMVKKGIPRDAAKETLVAATRRELASLAGDVQKIAKSQIQAKAIGKDLLKKAREGFAGEAVTEMGQEAIGYLAATNGSDKEFDWADLNNRLISAAIAGGSLGAGLSAPGAAYNAGAWADVAYRTEAADAAKASDAELYAAVEKEKHGRVPTIQEIATDARARWAENPGATIAERTAADKERQAGKSSLDKLGDAARNVPSLWQGATRNIFTPDMQSKFPAARRLADMFGGNLQRIFPGSNFENSKHLRLATYKNFVADPREFFLNMNVTSRDQKASASDTIYSTLNSAVSKDGVFNPDAVPANTKNRDAVIKLGKELNALGDRLYEDQKRHNPELGYVKNYLFKYKGLNAKAVKDDQTGFTKKLKEQYKLSDAEAKEITDNIVNNPEVNDIDEAFSVVKGGISPASHKKRTLGLSENKEFANYLERDIFANASQAAKSAARYVAHREFIGENGGVVNKLLDDLQAEGMPEAEVDRVASRIQDYLDAESGNYKRATTTAGKKFEAIQKNVMMATTLASLPLATISSFVEYALTHSALRQDQIFGKEGSLKHSGQELMKTLWAGMKNVAGFTPLTHRQHAAQSTSREIIKDLGYLEWDVGAATTTVLLKQTSGSRDGLKGSLNTMVYKASLTTLVQFVVV